MVPSGCFLQPLSILNLPITLLTVGGNFLSITTSGVLLFLGDFNKITDIASFAKELVLRNTLSFIVLANIGEEHTSTIAGFGKFWFLKDEYRVVEDTDSIIASDSNELTIVLS
jgi:hypothetical protein